MDVTGDRSRALAIAPAHGQVCLIRLKKLPGIVEEIAAFDMNRSEAFAPLEEV